MEITKCNEVFIFSGSRVFALGVFAATYPILLVPVCVAHWLAMLAWLIVQGNQECADHCEEALLKLVVAFIYVFTFFNVREEPTRYKYLTFYLICFLENTILIFTWFFSFNNVYTSEIFWFRVSGTVGDYALFFLGIICMITYYVYFHPSLEFRSKSKKEFQAEVSQQQQQQAVTKNLGRKGSIDLVVSNPHSATSSRKIVTFAPEMPKAQDGLDPSSRGSDGDKISNKMYFVQQQRQSTNTEAASEETPL